MFGGSVMMYKGPVIDGHLHVNSWFDSEGTDFYAGFDDILSRRGVEAMNIAANPIGEWGPANNMLAALYKHHNPGTFIHGGIMYPGYPVRELPLGTDPLTQYRELKAIGFDGVKILDTKAQYHKEIDNPVNLPFYEPFFAEVEKDGTHVLWHVCDPEEFWDITKISKEHIANGWYYGDGTFASSEEIYSQVFDVLKRHPNLKVTFAHFFFYSARPGDLEKLFETYPGVNVDITPGTEMYVNFTENRSFYRDFFIKYSDRISFGTDTFFPDKSDTLFNNVIRFLSTEDDVTIHGTPARGLDLPENVCRKILHDNFANRVSSRPKPIDARALKKYIGKYNGWVEDKDLRCLVTKAAESL